MDFLSSSIKEKRDLGREELRKFLLMKDRAIIDLGLDENETAELLEKRQREMYLGTSHNVHLQNWKQKSNRKKIDTEREKEDKHIKKCSKQKAKKTIRNIDVPKTKE